MRRALRTLILAISVSALLTGPVLAGPGAIPLNNGQETTDAKFGGSGSFRWWIDGGDLCYEMSVRNLTVAPFAAHIHGVAGRRVATGILITLLTPPAATSTVSDCISDGEGDAAPGEIAAVAANPGDYYVNVHTTTFPGGEVRGQLK